MLVETLRLLLPALFPSWRFFKEVGARPTLELRGPGGAWKAVMERPARLGFWRTLGRMFWNGHWNEYLYLMSLTERLDETGDPEIEDALSRRLRHCFGPELTAGWQFRIVFVGRAAEREVSYESAPQALRG